MARKTILIADDDSRLVKALSIRLQEAGYAVIQAPDAYHALGLAVKLKPDLLLLDIHMPAGEGFSVLERMKNLGDVADIPVVFLTGDSDPKLQRQARTMGAIGIVAKPVDSRALIQLISHALRERVTLQAA